MKKKGIFYAILGLALIAGCTKETQPTPTQAVTFGIASITSGSMDTKATAAELLATVTPNTYPTLIVESTTDRNYWLEVAVGETVELPIASYRVTATYTPSRIGLAGGHEITELPPYHIDETIEVKAGQESVELTGVFDCWALILDYETTASYRMDGHFYNFVNSADGTKGVLFLATQTQGNPWDLIVYPQDAVNYLETTYRLGNKTAGRWYCFGAEQKTVQEGSFRVAFTNWEEGE